MENSNNNIPKTIDDLKTWYIAMDLGPEESTGFIFGKPHNMRSDCCYIYEDGGTYAVYNHGELNWFNSEEDAVADMYSLINSSIKSRKYKNTECRIDKGVAEDATTKKVRLAVAAVLAIMGIAAVIVIGLWDKIS